MVYSTPLPGNNAFSMYWYWNLLVYPLISYFLFFLKSKWAQKCQHFTRQGTLPASLCQWQTSLTNLSPSPHGISPESFSAQHCKQLPVNEQSWARSEKYLPSLTHVRVLDLHLHQSWEFYKVLPHPLFHSSRHSFLFPYTKMEDLRVSTNGSWTCHS